jgi:outer membrane protein assembly factor BamB
MTTTGTRFRWLSLCVLLLLPFQQAGATHLAFAPGDVIVALEPGPVQWWHPDGLLNRILIGTVPGGGEGLGFDRAGNLYVTRWCIDPACSIGDTVEMFNAMGQSMGQVGSGYNCGPHAIVFDTAGAAYVGHAGCTGSILKFPTWSSSPMAFAVEWENQGSFWIDLAPDQCTIFYTSLGPNVKRFDGCAGVQLPNFNVAPLPGGLTHDLRVLPDGGVLVASGEVIARLNAAGALVQTYAVTGEPSLWAGLDLVGDGTFWAANYESSNIHRFNLTTGALMSSFNTGTPSHTAVAVAVRK